MPTSETGTFANVPGRPLPRPVAGFTLIEVLVVVVLIGVLSAVALLSVGSVGLKSPLEDEARRLHALLLFAGEESLMQGRDLGLRLDPEGYRFLSYDPESFFWEELSGDDLYKSRQLPEDVYMELFLEEQEVVLDSARTESDAQGTEREDGDEEGEKTAAPEPQLLILSSGEVTPFQLWIGQRFEQERYLIEGQANGQIDLLYPEAEER
jgi:general secretion pathway protein H